LSSTDVIRAFVAFEMPEEIRETIRRQQQALKLGLPRARWTRPEGQHLTLKFLGETPRIEIADLANKIFDRVRDLAAVEVRLGGAGFFPNAKRPRVAWVGGEADGGREVAAAVDAAAVRSGFPPERRPWSPHLTQARIDRPWPRTAVEQFLDWGRGLELEPFRCPEIVVYQSDLRRGGAVYTALERIPLK
jgi:2'-5' RNA ligase